MKVCFVTSNYPPEALGGTEQVVTALARELSARGASVIVISGSDVPHAGVDVVREEHEGVPVHRVLKLPDEWDPQSFVRPRILQLVRGLLEQQRPDVMHLHSTASLGTGVTKIARELGVPCAMTFHDLWVTCARYFRVSKGGVTCPTATDREPCVRCLSDVGMPAEWIANRLAERDRVLRDDVALASLCTAPSATAAAFVRDCLPYAGPIEVIPHGLLRAVPAEHRAAPPRPGETLRIGTFGGLVPEKGLFELADAAAGLPVELHLSGRLYDGAVFEHVRRREREGLRVVWRGHGYTTVDRHPARDLHLAVFPSKCQETYGLVVDEALAHGVPAVLSDRGAFAERRGAPGIVVTPIAQLANVLRELIASPEKIAALRAAIPAALPTIAASAERHLELYRRLR